MTGVPTRKCSGPCGERKPLTREHFAPDENYRHGLNTCCRDCRRARRHRLAEQARRERLKATPLREGEICSECFDLPHRVEGQQCWRCGSRYRSEPPPSVLDYLYKQPDRVLV